MSEDNAPLSYRVKGESQGLDVRLAQAVAVELGRPLKVVPFESKRDQDSTLSQEVNAMLSSGVCDIASGFAMLATDLGPPTRATARVPDHPGAKRPPLRAWVPLRTLVASRAYHAMAMGLVVRDPARENATLAEPGDARIGAVSGTLAGTAVSMYRNGKLRSQVVSLSQNQDVLEQLEAGRFDATLVALDRLDAWRISHPGTALRRAAYVHPFRINIGFVAAVDPANPVGATEVLAATNRVLDRALANGDLQRWSADAGVTWVEPATPQVGAAFGLAALVQE
jgi:ABC-type amino acid transport substrate-binding protein